MPPTQLPVLVVYDVWHIIIAMLCERRRRPGDDDESGYDSDYDSNYDPHEPEPEYWRPKKIARLFPHVHALIRLSSTCKGLRNLLAPRIFNTLYLRNTTKSALSVQAVADGDYAHCVKTLRYVGICELDQRESPLEEVYPPELDRVLSNLPALFSNLHHLAVDFPYDDELAERWSEEFCDEFEGTEQIALAGEKSSTWTSNQIPSFEIRHLNFANISTFYTDEFHSFLSRLESFTLSIKPFENGGGWAFNTSNFFPGFADCLVPWFLSNRGSVEEFTFDSSHTSPLGSGNIFQAYPHDIGLRYAEMRSLRVLTLGNIVICPELQDFLSRHLGTLRSITLQECYAIEPSDRNHPDAYAWRHFFPPLTEALAEVRKEDPSVGPTKFNVIYNKTPAKMLRLEDPPRYTDANLIARAKAKLAMEHKGPSMFYGDVDQKYGGLFHKTTTSLEEFLYGDDETEYRRFMAVVQRGTVVRGK